MFVGIAQPFIHFTVKNLSKVMNFINIKYKISTKK